MMHDATVLCLAASRDGELLASGCKAGKLKVWRLSNGKQLRKFDRAHKGPVADVAFSRDGTQLLSGSFDQTVRVHGECPRVATSLTRPIPARRVP